MNITDMPSSNFDSRKGVEPTIIILHYTGMKDAKAALDRMTNAESKVAAHYTIDEGGVLYQHVDEKDRAWHVGQSFWRGLRDINAHSIGVELVNPGHEHGYRPFPEKQIAVLEMLCQDMMQRYDIEFVLAHSDVAPDRKQDPGELFPWKRLAKNGIGHWPEVCDEDKVKSAGMDIYTALKDCGYDAEQHPYESLVAFQRHFMPQVFEMGTEGIVSGVAKATLYAVLARGLPP